MKERKTSDLKSFIYLENGEIQRSEFSTTKVSDKLEPNIYVLEYTTFPESKTTIQLLNNDETSKIFNFDHKEELDKYFHLFFNNEIKETIESLGFYHKFGILLHGGAGNGKSTVMKYYYTIAIKKYDALIFIIRNEDDYGFKKCWDVIKDIRKIQPNPIILVLDEFDSYLESSSNFSSFKKVTDGEDSINNCLFLAATNHINKIPKEFTDRKSRFRYSIEVNKINDINSIYEILHFMLNKTHKESDIKTFSKSLKDHSLDDIKQFAIDKIMNMETSYKQSKKILGFIKSEIN